MRKRILVIGGTYFIGRVFLRLAARGGKYDLYALNRGNHPLKDMDVVQIVADRHDAEQLAAALPQLDWDAVVDFCAYEPGEIASLVRALPGAVRQYVYISSCSVYDPAAPSPKYETSPLLASGGGDPGREYGYKKLLLEREAAPACADRGAALAILRPAMVYGPLNYAPRESFYFDRLLRDEAIPDPTDATGRFQFVYVKDVAGMIMACLDNPPAHGEAFNLSAPECLDYRSYLDAIAAVHGSRPRTAPVTVRQVYDQGIALPFPLDFDMLYDGAKAADRLRIGYTPFLDGMRETHDIYMDVHGKAKRAEKDNE